MSTARSSAAAANARARQKTSDAAITYGCQWHDCGYKTMPSTMGTPYTKCPLCGGPWIANPPEQMKTTGRVIYDLHNGHKTRTIVVRPQLRSLYERIEQEKTR